MNDRPNIILDLDETLIHSIKTTEFIEDEDNLELLGKFKDRTHNMDYEYVVFERPNLQEFLDFLFKNFNVSVWTAANKDYALFIIEHCILSRKKNKSYIPQPQRQLDYIFYDKHRDRSQIVYGKKSPKQLKLLWEKFGLNQFNSSNTFIIDDHPEVKSQQPQNCVAMVEFIVSPSRKNDRFLKKLQSYLDKTVLQHYKAQKIIPKSLQLK